MTKDKMLEQHPVIQSWHDFVHELAQHIADQDQTTNAFADAIQAHALKVKDEELLILLLNFLRVQQAATVRYREAISNQLMKLTP